MKNLMAGAMLIFGTVLLTAQVTPKQDTTRTKSEKKMNKKSPQTAQPNNGINRTIDTTGQNSNNNWNQPKTTTKKDTVWNKSQQPTTR